MIVYFEPSIWNFVLNSISKSEENQCYLIMMIGRGVMKLKEVAPKRYMFGRHLLWQKIRHADA